jgi:hypothetical protein
LVSTPAAERIGLVAASTVKIESGGFAQQGQEQGFNLYSRDSVPAGTPFEVSISGTAPPPSATDDPSQQGGGGTSSSIQVLPNRLDSIKWMLLGGFALLFTLGVISIWRRPLTATEAALASEIPAAESNRARNARKKAEQQKIALKSNGAAELRPATSTAPSAASSAPTATATAVAAVEREVEHNLDGLKDKLFRLELRRQAGTISDEDYLRERTQAEKVLRELVGH